MTLFYFPVDQALARSTRGVRRTSRPALAVAILELIVLIAVVIIGVGITLFGFSFQVLTSPVLGSTFPAGSLVISQSVPTSAVVAGEIVTIASQSADGFVTGSVLDVHAAQGGSGLLTLAVDDAAIVHSELEVAAVQRAVVILPEAGYFLATAAQPAALAFVVLVALGLILQVSPVRMRVHTNHHHTHRARAARLPRNPHMPHAA